MAFRAQRGLFWKIKGHLWWTGCRLLLHPRSVCKSEGTCSPGDLYRGVRKKFSGLGGVSQGSTQATGLQEPSVHAAFGHLSAGSKWYFWQVHVCSVLTWQGRFTSRAIPGTALRPRTLLSSASVCWAHSACQTLRSEGRLWQWGGQRGQMRPAQPTKYCSNQNRQGVERRPFWRGCQHRTTRRTQSTEWSTHLRRNYSSLVKMESLIRGSAMGPSSLFLQLACWNANAGSWYPQSTSWAEWLWSWESQPAASCLV